MPGAFTWSLPDKGACSDLAGHEVAYTRWLQNEVAAAEADPAPLVSHEYVLEGWERIIARAEARKKAERQ